VNNTASASVSVLVLGLIFGTAGYCKCFVMTAAVSSSPGGCWSWADAGERLAASGHRFRRRRHDAFEPEIDRHVAVLLVGVRELSTRPHGAQPGRHLVPTRRNAADTSNRPERAKNSRESKGQPSLALRASFGSVNQRSGITRRLPQPQLTERQPPRNCSQAFGTSLVLPSLSMSASNSLTRSTQSRSRRT
jgi:hypothetical protein